MKRFLMNLLVFNLILFTAFIALYLSISIHSSKNINDFKIEKNINKLIAGDSRTQYSINDKLVNNSKNISQNSEGLLYTYYKLKLLLKNNPQIDTVFLGVSYHTFSSYYTIIQRKPEVSGRYFFILPVVEQVKLMFDTKNTFPLLQYAFKENISNWYYGLRDTTLLGGFDCYSSSLKINDSLIDERIKFQFFNSSGENEIFNENAEYFNKIAELCKDLNVKLIILNTPMHKNYTAKVPARFKNILNELISKYNLSMVNFQNLILNDSDFLPDGDHLSESGAVKTSFFLNDLLQRKNN